MSDIHQLGTNFMDCDNSRILWTVNNPLSARNGTPLHIDIAPTSSPHDSQSSGIIKRHVCTMRSAVSKAKACSIHCVSSIDETVTETNWP